MLYKIYDTLFFKEYKKIINHYKRNLKIIRLEDIKSTSDNFFFVRHDVEFSVQRAFELAKFEKNNLGISTNFFFQLKNNAYNLISNENIDLVKKIQMLGHTIGLHFNYNGRNNSKEILSELNNQIITLKKYFKNTSNFFSPHRPNKLKYLSNINLKRLKNLYSKEFFTPFELAFKDNNKVLYIADSRHKWKFIHPLSLNLNKYKKIQLNFHPDAWSKKGLKIKPNYIKLINDNSLSFKNNLLKETDYLEKIIK